MLLLHSNYLTTSVTGTLSILITIAKHTLNTSALYTFRPFENRRSTSLLIYMLYNWKLVKWDILQNEYFQLQAHFEGQYFSTSSKLKDLRNRVFLHCNIDT